MRKLVAVLFGLIVAAGVAGAAPLKENVQYVAYRPPHLTSSPNRIEVVEFFWYGCGHCYHFDSPLHKWAQKLPKDVVFRRVPAVFATRNGLPGPWASGARIYYTLEAMGLVDKLHRKVFDAVQKERVRLLSDDNTLFAWMAKNGVDAKRFAAIYHSYTIDQAKIPQSMQLTASYNFDGVPAVIVDGRYRALNAPGDDHVATLAVVDQLIAMARKDRAARK